jgi:hypothetical protein
MLRTFTAIWTQEGLATEEGNWNEFAANDLWVVVQRSHPMFMETVCLLAATLST